ITVDAQGRLTSASNVTVTPAFSSITAATNTNALVIGSGGSLTTSGGGTITATSVPGSGVSGNISGNAANVTGTVAIANGGTGQGSQQAAINALTGTQSAGKYLRSDGTNATLSSIQAGDVPTLNQNTTGSAGSVAFSGVTGATNTSAAMVVGSGASL